MLKIYNSVIFVLHALRPVIERIEERDASLGDQIRRCCSSVASTHRRAQARRSGTFARGTSTRFAREIRACLDVATAWAYIEPVDSAIADRLDHITAVLWKLTH